MLNDVVLAEDHPLDCDDYDRLRSQETLTLLTLGIQRCDPSKGHEEEIFR